MELGKRGRRRVVQCIQLIRPRVLYNGIMLYKLDGIISEHYFYTWPQLGPPENRQYNRDGLLSGLHCIVHAIQGEHAASVFVPHWN